MTDFDLLLQDEIEQLKKQGLFREMRRIDGMQGPSVAIEGKKVILLSSNNYLGLSSHPEVIKAQIQAARELGSGSCASRLISGNMTVHERLEERIADFKGTESAVLFSTGYMANVGTISAIAEKGDLVVCDKLNHASIIDGVRLSGAMLRTYPHKNLKRLEDILREKTSYKKTFIITDGVFSMDGDIAPLGEIVNIAKKYKAVLMLDDAHGTGVLGKKGKGTCEHLGIGRGIDIHMGTFSKAFGNLGGYIAGSGYLMDYIRNKARSFIYSTAIPPAVAAGCIKAIDIVEKESALRNRLWRNIRKFTGALSGLGFDIMGSETQIVPVYTGSLSATMKTSEFLFKNGVFAPGIRPPTVAKNRCRIRLSLMATHTDEHIEKTIDVFRRLKDERILCNGN